MSGITPSADAEAVRVQVIFASDAQKVNGALSSDGSFALEVVIDPALSIDPAINELLQTSAYFADRGQFGLSMAGVSSVEALKQNLGDLPEWLSFDTTQMRFAGQAPEGFVGGVPVRLDMTGDVEFSVLMDVVVDPDYRIVGDGAGFSANALDERILLNAPEDYYGTFVLSYDAEDVKEAPAEAPAKIFVNVEAAAERPDAREDTFAGVEGQVVRVALSDLIANDVDVDGHAIRITGIGLPEHQGDQQTIEIINIFDHLAREEGANYVVALSDGTSLPDWMEFNAASGLITATVPRNYSETLELAISQTLPREVVEYDASEPFNTSLAALPETGGERTIVLDARDYLAHQDGADYHATLADGSLIRAWMDFDPATGVLTAEVPDGFTDQVGIRFTQTLPAVVNEAAVTQFFDDQVNGDAMLAPGTVEIAARDQIPAAEGAVFAATLSDGSSLPDWMVLDAETGTITATVPLDVSGTFTISLTRTLDGGEETVEIAQSLNGMALADLVYTPAPDISGMVHVTYTVTDDRQGESTGVVKIDLAPANDPPVARDDELNGEEDTSLIFNVSDILINDTDVDGDALSVLSFGTPSSGAISRNGDTITYTPVTNFDGLATVTYVVSDGTDGEDTGQITFDIAPTNLAPVTPDLRIDGTEDTPAYLTIADLMALVSDPDPEDTLTFVGAADAENANVFETQDGRLQFTPADELNGEQVFTYTVSDGRRTSTGEIVVDYAPVNDAPLVTNDTGFEVNEDQPLTIDFATLMANDVDIEGDAFSVVSVYDGDNGVVVAEGQSAVFTPRHDYFGNAKFKYVVEDAFGAQSIGEVFITVLPVDDVPVIIADAGIELNEDTDTVIDANAFVANDIDPDGGILTLVDLSGPHLSDLGDGLYRFAPDANANGAYQVTYTVANQYGVTTSGTVDVTVLPVADAPDAQYDVLRSFEDLTFSILQSDLLANDSDADGDALRVSSVTAGDDIEVSLESDGTIRIVPRAEYSGVTGFSYTVEDATGLTDRGSVELEILAVNDAPDVTLDTFDGGEAEIVTIPLAGLLSNDSDIDGDALSVTAVTSGPGYTAALDGSGNMVIARDPAFSGTLTVSYMVSDGTTEVESSVAIALTPSNRAPVLNTPAEVNATEDNAISITLPADVVSDPDGDAVTLSVTRAGGLALPEWLSFDADSLTFSGQPPVDFNGVLGLEIHADDGALTTTAPLRFVVDAVNDIPVILAPLSDRNTLEDRAFDIQLQSTLFADVDGDALSFALTLSDGAALPDWIAFDADRVAITGTPPENFEGEVGLRLSASDGQATVSDEFVLLVTPEDDAPILVTPLPDYTTDDAGEALATGVPFTITLPDAAFADPDGDPLSYAIRQSDGSEIPDWLSFDGAQLTGTAPRDDAGQWEFELFATDGNTEVSDIFTVTLEARNSAPVAGDDGTFEVAVVDRLAIDTAVLLANDGDFDGDPLEVATVTAGAGGTVELVEDQVIYTPFLDFEGEDQFTYTVTDGADSDTATVTVSVANDFGQTQTGGNGTDILFGGRGSDLVAGGAGSDVLFGGRGADAVFGGEGSDLLFGGRGSDQINGGEGDDIMFGGRGRDTITGGAGDDLLFGGQGVDTFTFETGDGSDRIVDFRPSVARRNRFIEGDKIALGVEGIDSFDDLLEFASQERGGVLFDFGEGDELFLSGTRLAALDEDQFSFY